MSSASPPEGSPGSSSPSSPVNASHGSQQTTAAANNAPKYGTLVPNRIFVGGISGNTTESELAQLFSAYGNVKATKVISDRAGVSKGYGFVTFETAEEATRLMTQEADGIVLKERKLNIAPAIKKQPFGRSYEVASPPTVHGNAILCQNGMPYTFHNGVAYFASAPTHAAASTPLTTGGDPTIYPATAAAAYVPQAAAAAAAAAAAHSPPATYPIFYPCTAQPIYMSQQFQYPALAAQGSHQFVYAGPASTASPGTGPAAGSVPAGSGGGSGGPPATPCQPQPATGHTAVPPATTVHLAAAPAAAHYYGPMPSAHTAPTAADPSAPELYYSVTPVHPAAHPYATAALFATTPDGFLFETQPVTESSSNHSPEDSSSSSSRSEVGQTRCVQRDSDCSGTHSQDGSCPPMPPAPASAPPVVSLLKLQQQHHHHHNHHHQQQQQQQQQQQPQPVVPLQTCDDSSLGPHFRQLPTPSAHVMYGTPVFFNHPHHHQQQRTQPTPPVPYRQPRMRRPQYRREPPSLPSTPIRPNSVAAGAGPPGPRYGFPAGRRGPGASSSAHRRAQSPPTAHTPPPLSYSPLIRSRAPFPQPVPTPSNQFQGAPPRPATTYFQSTTSASGTDGPRRYGPRKSGPNNGGRYTGGGGGPKPAATGAAAAAARLPATANSSSTDDRAGGDGPSVVPLPPSCSAVRASSPCESETTVITAAAAVAADSTHEVCRELQALTV